MLSFLPRVDVVAVEEIWDSEKVASRGVESCHGLSSGSPLFSLTRSSTISYTSHIHMNFKKLPRTTSYDINKRHPRSDLREEGDL